MGFLSTLGSIAGGVTKFLSGDPMGGIAQIAGPGSGGSPALLSRFTGGVGAQRPMVNVLPASLANPAFTGPPIQIGPGGGTPIFQAPGIQIGTGGIQFGPGAGTSGGMGACGCGPKGLAGLGAAAILSNQIPMIQQPQTVSVQRAGCGYTLVCLPNGQKIAMLKEVAYALGLKHRPTRRSGLSGRDLATAARVQRFISAHTVARHTKGPRIKAAGGKHR